jgi:diguanylate cyclase (GGDEF)-like protein/PAS domain S-box-containing protein
MLETTMPDNEKTKEQLISELDSLRREIAEHRENEDRFRTVAQTAVDAIILADVQGNVIFWNESAHRIFGYTEEEIAGKPLTVLMSPEDRDAHQKGLEHIRLTGKSKYIGKTKEIQALRKNGEKFPIELSIAMWNVGEKTFYSSIVRDITKRKRLESELQTRATTDTLTQVYNRIKYDEIMKREIERAKRYNHPLSLIMFDIDHFKMVNDTYGHAVGDYVLQALTHIVKLDLRETDYLVRWGGEEFVIIAPDTDIERAEILAERVRKSAEEYKFERVGTVTVSFGVTQFTINDTEDTFIKRTDDALYSAKRMGRNRVEVII